MLARWARRADYDVTVACGSEKADLVRAENVAPVFLETIPGRTFYERVGRGEFFYTPQELEAYVQAERALIQRVRPNLVVSDFRLTLAISSALEAVPLLSICNAHWSPGYRGRYPGPLFGLNRRLPAWMRDGLFKMLKSFVFRSFTEPLDNLRRKHGLPVLGDLRAHYTAGRWCAYLDLPSFVPVDPIPKGHFFLGPLPWTPRKTVLQEPDRIQDLGRQRKLVYVSAGSSSDGPWLSAILSCLKEKSVDVLVTGMDRIRAETIRKATGFPTAQWRHIPLLDPRPALSRAVLTVCHGGSGTVYQSLSQGVPVLCMPGNPDQQLVAHAVVSMGAGAQMDPCGWTVRLLRKTLDQLLEPPNHQSNYRSYREAAQSIKSAMSAHQAEETWVNFLRREIPVHPN